MQNPAGGLIVDLRHSLTVHRLGHAHDLISDLPNGGIDLPIGVNHFADEDASDGPVTVQFLSPSAGRTMSSAGCPVPDKATVRLVSAVVGALPRSCPVDRRQTDDTRKC